MDGMPDDLQFLPPDKERETDADIRKMLLEALLHVSKDEQIACNTVVSHGSCSYAQHDPFVRSFVKPRCIPS
jgi:hypothetical protein